jgi:hypothetical protein
LNDEKTNRERWQGRGLGRQGGEQPEERREGKKRLKQGEREEDGEGQRGRAAEWRQPWMRYLVKEGVIGRVGLKGKSAAKNTFTNCFKDSCGDLLDRLTKQFRT